jgi:protocatechuate 3,4-dioxygenase beta subunit
MGSTFRTVASLVVACAVVVVGTPSAAQTTRTLTVTPDTDLVDGDVVALGGTGFTPSNTVFFCQGVFDESPDAGDCGVPYSSAPSNDVGEFSAQYTVRRFISVSGLGMIDCAQPSANCAMAAADVLAPGGAAVVTPIAFAPQPPVPGQIFGTVTDPQGAPVPGADVWAYTPSDSWVGSLRTATDAQGSYAFAQVEPGVPYRILFRNPAGSPLASEWFDDQPARQLATVIVLSATEFTEVNAQLEETGAISGSVTDTNGNPVSGVQVRAFGPNDTWIASGATSTASDGTYSIGNLRPADYRIRFVPPAGPGLAPEWFDDAASRSLATDVTVSPGQTVAGIDAQLANIP